VGGIKAALAANGLSQITNIAGGSSMRFMSSNPGGSLSCRSVRPTGVVLAARLAPSKPRPVQAAGQVSTTPAKLWRRVRQSFLMAIKMESNRFADEILHFIS
jgi:hypothetical protein